MSSVPMNPPAHGGLNPKNNSTPHAQAQTQTQQQGTQLPPQPAPPSAIQQQQQYQQPAQHQQFIPPPLPTPPTAPNAAAAIAPQSASPPSKMDLKSWWRTFQKRTHNQDQHQQGQEISHRGIFGVPLHESIAYANVAISLVDESGDSYIYGYVPIVVAKCGVFLKEKATSVEGIFRLSGSEKRIKELKTIFDSPERYGKGLVWDGYTVHDAANVFRRYLNDLPEPVVPLDLYEKFREPLKGATKKTVSDGDGPQFVEDFDLEGAIQKYQKLIMELPPLNRQLLLYILDLLAVFAAKADENRMNSQNLAAVFSPGIISHPSHAMAPEEYRLNQCVLIFLIENQDHFLIGMQGPPPAETAASTSETQQSNTETGTTTSEALAQQRPAPVAENSMSPPTNSAASQAINPVSGERNMPAHNVAQNLTSPPGKVPEQSTPIHASSIPIITTPNQAESHGMQDYIGPIDEHGKNPNGLARSKSVPSSGRNKLKKPRPVSGNPSAQSSQASLSAPKS